MNKRDLSKVLIFIAGAAIGSAATWYLTKKHYDQVMEDEFESMQDYFEQKWIEKSEQEIGELKEAVESFEYTAQEKANMAKEKPDITAFAAQIGNANYVDYARGSAAASPKAPEPVEAPKKSKCIPYVISPEMVENSEYNLMTLTYYADGVLTDDWNDPENYADDLAGSKFEDHFGDYAEDVVHVRNDDLQIDYEITYDPRNYSDIVNLNQHSMEDE